jgi:hypothetical protein
MTMQVYVLSTNTQADGSFSVSGVFWLVAPTNRVVPIPTFRSQVPQIAAADLLSLRQGTLVEQPFTSDLFDPSAVAADVESTLASLYSAAQSALTALGPTVSGLVGLTFDGATWTTASAPSAAWITGQTPQMTADGRSITVHSIVKYTKNFSLRAFSFQTCTPSSVHNASPNGAMTDVTMKCFDSGGTDVTSSPSTAVKTVLDLEPSFLYEVIGGWVDIPDASRTAITTDGPGNWYMSAVGVPDVPNAYGGSIPFVHEVDLALIPSGVSHVVSDGRATSLMVPSGTYHTGKLRWIVKHPTGSVQWFQMMVETFQ